MSQALPLAVIFDLDDTIIADSEVSERCWKDVCTAYTDQMGEVTPEALYVTIRDIRNRNLASPRGPSGPTRTLREIRRDLLASALTELGSEETGLVEEMTDTFMALKSALVEPYPGALATLKELKESGIRLALITNGPAEEQRAKVRQTELESIFETILIEGEFGTGKPDPRVFLHTLAQLGLQPGQTWMVGDNLYSDVGGAQAVGIHGIWVDRKGTGTPANSEVRPDRTVRAITDLVT